MSRIKRWILVLIFLIPFLLMGKEVVDDLHFYAFAEVKALRVERFGFKNVEMSQSGTRIGIGGVDYELPWIKFESPKNYPDCILVGEMDIYPSLTSSEDVEAVERLKRRVDELSSSPGIFFVKDPLFKKVCALEKKIRLDFFLFSMGLIFCLVLLLWFGRFDNRSRES